MLNTMRMGVTRVAAKAIVQPVTQQSRRTLATPPRIVELQKRFNQNPHLHGADNPTYMKKGTSDYAVNALGFLLVFTCLTKIGSGLYHMSNGTNQLDVV